MNMIPEENMKRTTTAMIVLAAALLTLTSCGNREKNTSSPDRKRPTTEAVTEASTEPATKTDYHERHDYESGVLVGSWKGDFTDLDFCEDGTVSLHNDISDIIMFTSEKTLLFNGEEYPQENVRYDGSSLVVNVSANGEPVELLNASRIGEAAPDKLDGEYSFNSGYLVESLADSDEQKEKILPSLTMTIRNGHCFLTINSFCKYTQTADEVEFTDCTVDPSLMEAEFGKSTFVLEEDGGFTLYDADGNTEKFVKAD